MIWAGFSDPGFFLPLKEQLDQLLESCGIAMAEGEFNPHLTLGRIRGIKDLSSFYETVDTFQHEFRTRICAERLIFYRSELTPTGPRYSALEEISFPTPTN